MNNLVSIITPSFNSSRFIEECIDSVLSQTYYNWEIILWDNHSTDNTKQIVKSYNEDRIKYFYSKASKIIYQLAENIGNEVYKKSFLRKEPIFDIIKY